MTSPVFAGEAAPTPSQRARRERIFSAALQLAAEGGYEAVQMREVAERADVALGTLYRYFPSKVHLLVSLMARQLAAIRDGLRADGFGATGARERVLQVMTRMTQALARSPLVSQALVRAMMSADASVADEVDRVSSIMASIISAATHEAEAPTAEDELVAGIISKVFLSDLVFWLGGRMTIPDLIEDLTQTVAVVLPQ